MIETDHHNVIQSARLLIIGLVAVIVVMGMALIVLAIGQPASVTTGPALPNALENSSDDCVTCHRSATPGIFDQFGHSTMAAAKVTCRDCHETTAGYPGAVAHQGTFVLQQPTTAKCQKCHGTEVAQYMQSRHSLPAWVAYAGSQGLSSDQLAQYQAIPEGLYSPNQARNAIAVMEGADLTHVACEVCHSIGRPNPDGSVGKCSTCHLRHTFSLEQARKPETCSACHIGPDHPQWEIYQESAHGIAYSTSGASWHWNADPGTLTVDDFPAPACASCHMSGFGASGTTHDVGDRLTWYLFSSVSERRPSWQDNRTRMQSVCRQCHNQKFIDDMYTTADQAVAAVNSLVKESDQVMAPLNASKLLTSKPFDQSIDYTYFETWHHWGRTAKFGAWMQGPDYSQWHGAYEMKKAIVELQEQADAMMKAAGVTPTPAPGQ